jgi:hypothetical protein
MTKKNVSNDVLFEKISNIEKDVSEIKQNMVSQAEWRPYKAFVQGAISLVLLGVGGAVMALVINK